MANAADIGEVVRAQIRHVFETGVKAAEAIQPITEGLAEDLIAGEAEQVAAFTESNQTFERNCYERWKSIFDLFQVVRQTSKAVPIRPPSVVSAD